MPFRTAVERCLRLYVTVSGRAARPEFWWFALFVTTGSVLLGLLDSLIFGGDTAILAPLFSLATLLPLVAVSVRRLHDIGRSGWWVLLHLVPVVGLLVMLYFYLLKGDGGTNRFGPPPARNPGPA